MIILHADACAAELAAKDAEIGRLTEQVAIFGGVVGDLECKRSEDRREIRRLREALEPFAEMYRRQSKSSRVNLVDICRAAKALEG